MKKEFTLDKYSFSTKSIRKAWVLFAVLFVLVSSHRLYAQNTESLESKMVALNPAEAELLQSLVTDIHPIIYLTGGEMSIYAESAPEVVWCDAVSVNMLYDENPQFSQVKLIRLNIESPGELPEMDMTQLRSFTALKYLLIVFEFDACGEKSDSCLAEKVNEVVKGPDSPVALLYNLSIAE